MYANHSKERKMTHEADHRKRSAQRKKEKDNESNVYDRKYISTNHSHIRKAMIDTIQNWFPNFTPDFPLELQNDLYDIAILGAEKDRPAIRKLKTLFTKFIKNANGEAVDIVTIDRNAAHTSRDFRLEEILKRATLYFLFVTDDFLECSWAKFVKSETIEKTLAEKRSCVIPVYPDRKQRDVFGLMGIRGINILDLLKGKTIEEVDVGTITINDLRANLVKAIEKTVQKHSYVKANRRKELEDQRNIYTEKEKLRIIRETLDTRPNTPQVRSPEPWEARFEQQSIRPGDQLEVTLQGGLKVYLPVVDVKRRPVVDEVGEPIERKTKEKERATRVRADSNGSGSSFEDLSLSEFD